MRQIRDMQYLFVKSLQPNILPKNLVRIGKPRTLSEAQLRHLQELQNKA